MIDLTSCLTTLPGEVLTQTFWYVYPVSMICKVKSFFNMFTVESSALLLLIIAIDRHRKICYPFGWQIRPISAKLLCLVTLCIAFILALPVCVFYIDYETLYGTYTNHSGWRMASVFNIYSIFHDIMKKLFLFLNKLFFSWYHEQFFYLRLNLFFHDITKHFVISWKNE